MIFSISKGTFSVRAPRGFPPPARSPTPPVLHPPLLHSSQAGPAATGMLPLAHSARAACYMLHAHAAREARLDGRETRSSARARTRCWVSPNRRDCSASWFLAPCGTVPAARGLSCARARAMRGAAPTLRAFSRSFMWLACSSARAAGSSFAMLDRSAASAPLCGGARRRRDAIQRICKDYSQLECPLEFPPPVAEAPQDTDESTKVCAAPALPSAAAFARAALYGSALPFRAVCARRC